MAQPQPTMPARTFSPPQPSVSPGAATHNGFAPPPNKRAKLSPTATSQPNSPYAPSYAMSPGATTPGAATPSNGVASPTTAPTFSNIQIPPNAYNTPYQPNGGRATPTGLSLPEPRPVLTPQPTLTTPVPPNPAAPYSNATFATLSTPSAVQTPGVMGPPPVNHAGYLANNDAARQGESNAQTTKETYDMDDTLAGTGINLAEEERLINEEWTQDKRHGFANHPPGGSSTFYGAGSMNQPPESTDRTQEEIAAEAAENAWMEAARRLASTRSQEIKTPFLAISNIHGRAYRIAQEHNLTLNWEVKPSQNPPYMGRLQDPVNFPKPEVKIETKTLPDGAVVRTTGSFIPENAHLADQLCLISIATKQRLRSMLEDANKISTDRQKSSHGAIPEEWEDAAASIPSAVNGVVTQEASPQTGPNSAVSPRATPLKRSHDDMNTGLPTPTSEGSPRNYVVDTIVLSGKGARNAEESRLRKRQKREQEKNREANPAADASRAGSVAPGTPGPIAGEPEKAPTKKEGKKAAQARAAEASTSTVNSTVSLFTGGGRKGKKYSWMTSGGMGSGASTPRAQTGGLPGTPAATAAGAKPVQGPLTSASVNHLGQWREDSEKGKNIQLRDWVIVLEELGTDLRALQSAYIKLDKSDQGDKTATEKVVQR